jgi:hypothetical protein
MASTIIPFPECPRHAAQFAFKVAAGQSIEFGVGKENLL